MAAAVVAVLYSNVNPSAHALRSLVVLTVAALAVAGLLAWSDDAGATHITPIPGCTPPPHINFDVSVVIDASGSMSGVLPSVKAATNWFLGQLYPDHGSGLVTTESSATVRQSITNSHSSTSGQVSAPWASGSSSVDAAVAAAHADLDANGQAGRPHIMVVIGDATAASTTTSNAAKSAPSNIIIYSAYWGSGPPATWQAMSSSPGLPHARAVSSGAGLINMYQDILTAYPYTPPPSFWYAAPSSASPLTVEDGSMLGIGVIPGWEPPYDHAHLEWQTSNGYNCPVTYDVERQYVGNALLPANNPFIPLGVWQTIASVPEPTEEYDDEMIFGPNQPVALPCDEFEYRVLPHSPFGPGPYTNTVTWAWDPTGLGLCDGHVDLCGTANTVTGYPVCSLGPCPIIDDVDGLAPPDLFDSNCTLTPPACSIYFAAFDLSDCCVMLGITSTLCAPCDPSNPAEPLCDCLYGGVCPDPCPILQSLTGWGGSWPAVVEDEITDCFDPPCDLGQGPNPCFDPCAYIPMTGAGSWPAAVDPYIDDCIDPPCHVGVGEDTCVDPCAILESGPYLPLPGGGSGLELPNEEMMAYIEVLDCLPPVCGVFPDVPPCGSVCDILDAFETPGGGGDWGPYVPIPHEELFFVDEDLADCIPPPCDILPSIPPCTEVDPCAIVDGLGPVLPLPGGGSGGGGPPLMIETPLDCIPDPCDVAPSIPPCGTLDPCDALDGLGPVAPVPGGGGGSPPVMVETPLDCIPGPCDVLPSSAPPCGTLDPCEALGPITDTIMHDGGGSGGSPVMVETPLECIPGPCDVLPSAVPPCDEVEPCEGGGSAPVTIEGPVVDCIPDVCDASMPATLETPLCGDDPGGPPVEGNPCDTIQPLLDTLTAQSPVHLDPCAPVELD